MPKKHFLLILILFHISYCTITDVLESFYYDSNGDSWDSRCRDELQENTCWFHNNQTDTYCSWLGIVCDNNNNIIGLNLPSNGLVGTLTPLIGELTTLINLDLSDNYLESSIPVTIGNLTKLQSLLLNSNYFAGPIPDIWGNMSSLTMLDLSSNYLTGGLPASFVGLTSIEHFLLSSNALEGPLNIPSLFQTLMNTVRFVVSGNNFNGTLSAYLAYLPNLRILALNNNNFYGTIPDAYYKDIRNLTSLNLAYNNFSGSLSPNIEFLPFQSPLSYISIEGNPLMKSPGGLIPSFLKLDYNNRNLDENQSYYCLGLQLRLGIMKIFVSPDYIDYNNCYCASGYVGIPPFNCVACPEGFDCTNGGDSMTWSNGYYPIIVNSSQLLSNGSLESVKIVLHATPCQDSGNRSDCMPSPGCVAYWNKGVNDDCNLCQKGSGDRLCSKCQCDSSVCYYRKGSYCMSCETFSEVVTWAAPAFTVGILLAIIIVLLYLYLKKKKREHVDRFTTVVTSINSGHIKILLIFLQTANSLLDLYPNYTLKSAVRFLDFSNAKTTGLGLPCIIPSLNNPLVNLIVNVSLPVICLGLIGLAVLVKFLLSKRSSNIENERKPLINNKSTNTFEPTPMQFGLYLFIDVLYALYFNLANSALEVFNCQPEKKTSFKYMQSLPWLQCGSSEWLPMRNIAIVDFAVYVAGIPILFGVLLWVYRHRCNDEDVKYWLGNPLYQCYRPAVFWFELVMIVRRLLLAALISVVPNQSFIQIFGIYLVLLVSLTLQFYLKPYSTPQENSLEELSLISLILSYTALLSSFYDSQQSNLEQYVVVILVIISSVGVVVVILALFIRDVAKTFWTHYKRPVTRNVN